MKCSSGETVYNLLMDHQLEVKFLDSGSDELYYYVEKSNLRSNTSNIMCREAQVKKMANKIKVKTLADTLQW